MKFISTLKSNNEYLKSNFKDCLMNPIPLPNSLWFPDNIEKMSDEFFNNIDNLDFNQIALQVVDNLLGEDIPKNDLEDIITDSFNFKIPLVKCSDNISILELFHGPTFTFKDVGARFMSRILKYFYPNQSDKFDIIVSTSGDTGSAVADAFQDLPNVKVHILYPKNLISDIQEKQLTTYGDNVFAYQVDGNFDECQNLIKETLKDKDLTDRLLFFPANSINIARLIPQCLYYFWAYAQLKKNGKNINICVPSGNLGNLSGGILAYKLGLPVNHFIGATNINNTFEKYLNNGDEGIKEIDRAIPTLSNAMDISIPNNLKRLKFAFNDSNVEMSKTISSFSCSDVDTINGIKEFWNKYNYSIDPHTSVGYNAIKKYISKNPNKEDENYILISTAHPAKFYKTMDTAKIPYQMPLKISQLLKEKGKKINLKNNYNEWKEVLIKNSYSSVTLIGMPFSGKSFMAKYISDNLGYDYMDIDKVIEDKYNMKLNDVLVKYGNEKFKDIEEQSILELDNRNKIIFSPGGSVIYSQKSMEHLKKISKVIFLDVDFKVIVERMEEFNRTSSVERGIVLKDGQTFEMLFNERRPLYQLYSDFTINCYNLDKEQILSRIIF